MCGVAGILAVRPSARPPERVELLRMAAALRHRGPDARGASLLGRCGLAHTRLVILDEAGGAQPMSTGDGHLTLSYNGEVFDHGRLREELRDLGHVFATSSDTEVVLHAIDEWGEAAFARFNGQFAIAAWDARRQRLLLARDRLGVRPLYTCEHEGRLYFASEVKAIFAADPTIPRELDLAALDDTLTFWTAVAPRTAFSRVEEVPPATVRVHASGDRSERTYWQLVYPHDFPGTVEDAAEAVRAALDTATRARLACSDVPVGAYLSGGLDSSLVAALAQRASGARLDTFSVRFDDPVLDEGDYQDLVARELGTRHHTLGISDGDVARVFPDVVFHTERTLVRTAPAPLLLLSRAVREAGCKVVLTGEGADEMFGGYDLFREAKVRRFVARQPGSPWRARLFERLYPWLPRSPVGRGTMGARFFGAGGARPGDLDFAHDPRWRTTSAVKRLLARDVTAALAGRDARAELLARLPPATAKLPPLARDQTLEIKTLLGGYLLSAQGDRVAMASSVEGRFPFLDREVVMLANALPPALKLRVLDEKHVLKRAARGLVPEAVVRRPKQPYRGPGARALLGRDAPEVIRALVTRDAVARAGVFDPDGVARLLAKVAAAPPGAPLSNLDEMAIVAVVSTQLLHHQLVVTSPVQDREEARP